MQDITSVKVNMWFKEDTSSHWLLTFLHVLCYNAIRRCCLLWLHEVFIGCSINYANIIAPICMQHISRQRNLCSYVLFASYSFTTSLCYDLHNVNTLNYLTWRFRPLCFEKPKVIPKKRINKQSHITKP